MILDKQTLDAKEFDTQSFVTTKELVNILDQDEEFKEGLIKTFKVDTDKTEVLKIGNARQLLSSISLLDSQCKKIDIVTKSKDVNLYKLLDAEKALFEILGIDDKFILKKNKSDILIAETRYLAKTDLLEQFHFSKFANYCRDMKFDDLIDRIKSYLKIKNANNEELQKLRLVYKNEDNKFYIRAKTSSQDYKNFGINFSVFVALMSLNDYVEKTKNEIFINNYVVDDSNLYVSFALKNRFVINNKLTLSFNLLLENDEVKRSAVSFNGIFKLKYAEKNRSSEIYLKPKGYKSEDVNYPTDLLTYPHRGSVRSVFEKIESLPTLINHYITQIKNDAERISAIENPDDVRKLISDKIKYAKKPEFKEYKGKVFNKLISISVDNTFKLFELLRQVEELFEHDDVISKDFWRTKLYEALIERK